MCPVLDGRAGLRQWEAVQRVRSEEAATNRRTKGLVVTPPGHFCLPVTLLLRFIDQIGFSPLLPYPLLA